MSPFLEAWSLQLLENTFRISLVREHSDWTKKSFFTTGVKIKNVSAHLGKGKHMFRQPVTSGNFFLNLFLLYIAKFHKYRKQKSMYG